MVRARRLGRTLAAAVACVGSVVVAGHTPVDAATRATADPSAATRPNALTTSQPGATWDLAGQSCRLVPAAAATLGGGGECTGVRPGAGVLTPIGRCTLNFLWLAGDGRRYVGTAGHCVLGSTVAARVVFALGDGPAAHDGLGNRIGEFAYASLGTRTDFALIRLDEGVASHPQVCTFGGPTYLETDPVGPLRTLNYVGGGQATNNIAPARSQLTLQGNDPNVLIGLGIASPGDSGSPVVSLDGGAVAVVVATGPVLPLVPAGLLVHSVLVAQEMGRASEAMGLLFELVTA